DRFGCSKRMHLNHTSGKSGDCSAGVAKAHPTGAMAIQQRMQLWAFGELLRLAGNVAIVLVFLEKGFQVVEPIRIEKPKACEVPGHSKLFRSRGEKQQPRDFFAQLFDDRVLRAGALGRPVQVMRLIHNQHVPTGGKSLLGSLLAVGEQRDAAKDQLGLQEWVAVPRGLTSLLIVNVKPEIKAAQQFDEPLMNKRLGHENKDSLDSTGEDEPMQDEACLNRLAQPDLVSEKHAWRQARRNFGRNEKLVRKQIDASPEKTTH